MLLSFCSNTASTIGVFFRETIGVLVSRIECFKKSFRIGRCYGVLSSQFSLLFCLADEIEWVDIHHLIPHKLIINTNISDVVIPQNLRIKLDAPSHLQWFDSSNQTL